MLYSPIFRSDSGLAAAERRRAPDTTAVAAAAMAKSRRFILLCSGCIILSSSSDRVRVAVLQIDITVGGLGIRDAPRRGIPFEALPGQALGEAAKQQRFRHRRLGLETRQRYGAPFACRNPLQHARIVHLVKVLVVVRRRLVFLRIRVDPRVLPVEAADDHTLDRK